MQGAKSEEVLYSDIIACARAEDTQPITTYHKDSYMAHRRERLGWEGRYRRTASPNSQGGGGISLPPPVVIPEDLGIPLATRPDMTRVERVDEIKKVELEGRQSDISGWESQRTLTGSQ